MSASFFVVAFRHLNNLCKDSATDKCAIGSGARKMGQKEKKIGATKGG